MLLKSVSADEHIPAYLQACLYVRRPLVSTTFQSVSIRGPQTASMRGAETKPSAGCSKPEADRQRASKREIDDVIYLLQDRHETSRMQLRRLLTTQRQRTDSRSHRRPYSFSFRACVDLGYTPSAPRPWDADFR